MKYGRTPPYSTEINIKNSVLQLYGAHGSIDG
jgi:hypothetical protein